MTDPIERLRGANPVDAEILELPDDLRDRVLGASGPWRPRGRLRRPAGAALAP